MSRAARLSLLSKRGINFKNVEWWLCPTVSVVRQCATQFMGQESFKRGWGSLNFDLFLYLTSSILQKSAKSTPVSSQFLQTNCLNKTRGCDYSWADNKNQNQKSSAMSVPTFLSCLKTPTNRTPRKNASWVTWLLHSPVKPWANWLARSYFPLWTIFLQVYHLTFTAICHLPTFLRQL